MGTLVTPKAYLIGATKLIMTGLTDYLTDSGNTEFLGLIEDAYSLGLTDEQILTSFYGKLCYSSLSEGKNKNVKKIRSIQQNFLGILEECHGSVLEHATLNFAVHNASRVFEIELCRHRVGTAFSIQSGRYVRGDEIDIVFDPILEPVREIAQAAQRNMEMVYQAMSDVLGIDNMTDRDQKKLYTSALRRFHPEGKAKEIGFSINLRSLRHIIQLRTSRHSEWEIRTVFAQVYQLVKERIPDLFMGAREEEHRGIIQVSHMRLQPWEPKNRPEDLL